MLPKSVVLLIINIIMAVEISRSTSVKIPIVSIQYKDKHQCCASRISQLMLLGVQDCQILHRRPLPKSITAVYDLHDKEKISDGKVAFIENAEVIPQTKLMLIEMKNINIVSGPPIIDLYTNMSNILDGVRCDAYNWLQECGFVSATSMKIVVHRLTLSSNVAKNGAVNYNVNIGSLLIYEDKLLGLGQDTKVTGIMPLSYINIAWYSTVINDALKSYVAGPKIPKRRKNLPPLPPRPSKKPFQGTQGH